MSLRVKAKNFLLRRDFAPDLPCWQAGEAAGSFMLLGAYQSIAGGYAKALERVVAIGGNCLQIFSSSPRLKVCLDTCHLQAAGYDLASSEKLDKFVDLYYDLIGLERLELWHLNDSRDDFGSFRDRHENVGEGKVGKKCSGVC